MISVPSNMLDWTYNKNRIAAVTGLTDDALHIYVGLLILVVSAVLLRRRPWHWLPWLIVLIAELANEAYDMLQPYYPTDEGNIQASLRDLWLTMLWPTVILLTGTLFFRLTRWLSDQRLGKRADVSSDIGA